METLFQQFLSALVGGLVVYIFGIRKLSIELRNAFIQKQMSEFYSPIAGCRKRIRAKSEVRGKVSSAASEAWAELCAPCAEAKQPMLNHEERYAPYGKIIEYDNNQLREELIPLYRKMLDLFTEKYWLADEDTRAYYQEFLEFVEIWERYLAEALPDGVLRKLGHTEENVLPFYEHVESKLSALQEEINANRFWKLRL
ncbi:MAG TPA: hypothetical protein PLD21_09405 [Rhodocyclaceae bacterium]|nr:hypothetical protein [Rhodocyclaceae bacterium]HNA67857.1 hypothetical protein [Rhodocyclaceae bacterium]HNC80724.1 hypothetical protein [Rhodocyclaceae bacterium]HNE16334.1 hypothetical protein [Rhodocyclaceae bacterium]